MAGKVNLKINQGETFKHTFTWLDANGVVVDVKNKVQDKPCHYIQDKTSLITA